MRLALCPPKPKVLERATLTVLFWALLNVKLSNGELLIKGRKINSFTNEEEKFLNTDSIVPFMLETELKKRGCLFEKSGLWKSHVIVDHRIITGQNPQSALEVGKAILQELENL